ncbi:protein-glutamate methylesterase/protein-glutamine glutaminase [Evansella cellulosilytica]|uniref:Protein-glutamate methylesterase/protein-glutamine glutaminase n=1 Tax=Evansella cellulosilytica (strain ATCC 21833 / DSM 2522 / FERM P-1141 / JCM 9156 / N-4) TaxID=649639 RepID=E6TSU5_EVAC2|nr:chemotaxis response regulator protein-glutamate methylesterase [Evansella cellulosilytica]ADU30737.1 response regulator receiver modulated CheB methylesterase [Evansella cellulosilytica DSM 2522]
MIKVLVVDDSAFMRKMISDLLEKDARIKVIGKARNGNEAVTQIKKLQPDVVTLDVEMPILNGLEALKRIMSESPVPVIMLSSITKEGTETTIKAMEYGAFDFVSKPSGSISLDIYKVQKELVEKVIYASKVPIAKLQKDVECRAPSIDEKQLQQINNNSKNKLTEKGIIAIGTSTGGPKALQTVLTNLPSDLPYPILIVQHMPKGFTKSLSERLDKLSKIKVKEAEDGEIIKKGVAYIAPGGYHLKVRGIGTSVAVHLDQSELVKGHRPAVDALFYSLSALRNVDVMAIILTGMGSDGTKGLVQLKGNTKTIAIAESKETAIVYGMPRTAVETNLVDEVVKLEDITQTILKHCT